MQVRPMGDGALLIELGAATPATSARARALARRIRAERWPGVYDVVPAYRTVLLRFDPCAPEAASFAHRAEALPESMAFEDEGSGKLVEIPVCYGDEYGPDLRDVAAHTGLAPEDVVRLHAEGEYRVEFLGFSPGFPFLSGLHPALRTPRLASPRTRVPAGSVGIAGPQTGFYPLESPGGWRLIGRIPALRFDLARPETLAYAPGDTIRFVPIDPRRYIALAGVGPAAEAAPRDASAKSVGFPASYPREPVSQGGDPTDRSRRVSAPGAHSTGVDPPSPIRPQSQAAPQSQASPQSQAAALRVVRAGPLATIQDRGRFGLNALGYGTAGAMDAEALQIANALVGNDPGAAALELTLDGGAFVATGDLVIALTGADLSPTIDDVPAPLYRACALRDGARLRFGARRSGLRAYLAVAGGITVPMVYGSRATDLVAQLGGLDGRALRAGDVLPIGAPQGKDCWAVYGPMARRDDEEITVRILWGPQDHWFDEEARARVVSAPFAVSPRSDRTGIRLEGAPLIAVRRTELASEGVAPGAIQVPADGNPIVLLADGRGIGGYPKIAAVISADLHLLGQVMAGTRVRFSPVTIAQVREAARVHRERLRTLPLRPAPEPAVRCLLEAPGMPHNGWRCPRAFACLVSQRCAQLYP